VRVEPFRMERMQSRFENYVDYNLSESGVHPMTLAEALGSEAAARDLLATGLGYCQSNGTEELRETIGGFYAGAGRDHVLVTNGGSEANYVTFWSLLEPGDRVAYMIPNYLQTLGLARAFAGRADAFRLLRRGTGPAARWALDRDGLRRAVSKRTRVILVTNPNNPTGAVLTAEEMDAVVRAARSCGAWIVADEIYRGAEVAGATTPSFWGRYDRVIVTSGLSKAFGLPGLRVGWVVGPPRAVERIWSYRDYTTIGVGTLSERLARLAMRPERREAIFARTRGIIRANLPLLERWIAGRDGLFDHTPPQAGAIAFLRYRLPIASIPLVERLRTRHSVLIVPGDHFGVPKHVRIGFGSEAGYLEAGLRRIGAALAALRNGRPERRGQADRRRRASSRAVSRSATRPSSCIS
jgi:hypothetical protein